MKKTILLLLIGILCVVFFTGCPGEVKPAEENKLEGDKYPRYFNFDKEEFDTHYKAWSDAGIKNYQFKEKYFSLTHTDAVRVITVKNGFIENVQYYTSTNEEINLDAPPVWVTEEYIAILKSGIYTIDEIYTQVAEWYESNKNKDLKSEFLAAYGRLMDYDEEKHYPKMYEIYSVTEKEYDAYMNKNLYYDDSFPGWEDAVYDFKVLD